MRHFTRMLQASLVLVCLLCSGADAGSLRVRREAEPCPYVEVDCDSSYPYRSIDGTCNNLVHTLWGSAEHPFDRFLEPDFADGFDSPRVAKSGQPLPGARAVSRSVYEDVSSPSPVHTLMHMVLGQFLDHDITLTPLAYVDAPDGTELDVTCGADGCQTEGIENIDCFPIPVDPSDDSFGDRACLSFVRSEPAPRADCTGPRENLNEITSMIDGSQIYGSDDALANELRLPGTGYLRGMEHPTLSGSKLLLPVTDDPACVDAVNKCFLSGDERANENIGLSSLHTLFFRMHNALVDGLTAMNPQWDGERLYQEARRIVGATMQVIVYREFVPVVLGRSLTNSNGLKLLKNGFTDDYDRHLSPAINSVFATAAYRFGHTLIPNLIQFTSQDFGETYSTELSNLFFRPAMSYQTDLPGGRGIDSLVLGLISQRAERVDRFFSEQITEFLFSADPPHVPGTDLPSLNTQRGRDHGLPGYNAWREFCGLPKAMTFDDLADTISSQVTRDKFEALYETVDDIDLFPAGVAEDHVPGGMVGPTFGCIIAKQFRNLKYGDRFWHERRNKTTGFSHDQLNEIRKMTLARVLCDNLDNVDQVQKFVLLQPLSVALENAGPGDALDIVQLYAGEDNERRPCTDIETMDLSAWAEDHGQGKGHQGGNH